MTRKPSKVVVLVAAVGATAGVWAFLAPSGAAADTAGSQKQIAEGRAIYQEGCATCHGLQAQGNTQGSNTAPSLIGVGGAAVDFQVSSGRMPLAQQSVQAERKKPAYDDEQIQALDAYIQSLGPGPAVPTINLSDADLSLGGELFRTNCASCHNAAGAGGALSNGRYAPALTPTTNKQVLEAILTGPESMPDFNGEFTQQQQDSLVAYVQYLRNTKDPGGFAIGHIGPVPEGLVIWLVGIGGLVIAAMWIGARR